MATRSTKASGSIVLGADGLRVWQGDITTLSVDMIVNAANESLLGGGGVDGAIHRAAGPELLTFCRTLGGCPTGEARLTPGFGLPARWIAHTVGPVWQGGQHQEPHLLAACYRSVFSLAIRQGARSIAFPAISCGVYGYPAVSAARIAATECRTALQADNGIGQITLVAYDAKMATVLTAAIDALPPAD
ncbi:MAG: O-acetyl-ADP-ribose deacetylase [Proteobacteria bacterium]|nr:MAG: O-acetyl-ADP-ribose deacetylase [Pseudomonadota bacterium]